jgi:hypothetical protein
MTVQTASVEGGFFVFAVFFGIDFCLLLSAVDAGQRCLQETRLLGGYPFSEQGLLDRRVEPAATGPPIRE